MSADVPHWFVRRVLNNALIARDHAGLLLGHAQGIISDEDMAAHTKAIKSYDWSDGELSEQILWLRQLLDRPLDCDTVSWLLQCSYESARIVLGRDK